ncbi:MAG: toll/interleukin-1 receptor domain-containing protein [Acidobacteria bacterium]|nr:toll/interleukin-1 receptor domain-containing protein [Acidobacteriota bacterium]
MAETFKYDVFISHSEKDKPAARELAERLRRGGQRVGLKMTRKAEGAGEITVYRTPGVAVEAQVNFTRYVPTT